MTWTIAAVAFVAVAALWLVIVYALCWIARDADDQADRIEAEMRGYIWDK